jgi:hypothetical protein
MLARLLPRHYRGRPLSDLDMALRKLITRSTLGLASAAALVGGCNDFMLAPEPPELPSGAEALVAPSTYVEWWRETERCAGVYAELKRVSWFVVPNRTSFPYRGGQYDGYWWNGVHWILLAGDKVQNAMIVRHEMLHDLLGKGNHPARYFQERCAGVVGCNEVCRADS